LTRIIQVRTGETRSDHAYVAVTYRDHWFWIDGTDTRSKRDLSFLMILFASTEREGEGAATPPISIPVSN